MFIYGLLAMRIGHTAASLMLPAKHIEHAFIQRTFGPLFPTNSVLQGLDGEEELRGELDAVVTPDGVDLNHLVAMGLDKEKRITSLTQDDLEGTLCPIVVRGSVRSRFLTYMKSTLGQLAETAITRLEDLCEVTKMHDGQRLKELQKSLFELRDRTVPSWTKHAHPDGGTSTAELLEGITSGPPAAVLDYGSGDGTDLAAVASYFSLPRDAAVGVDVDPDSMISQNKEHVTFWHLKEPLEAGLAQLSTAYASKISVAWAFGVLHHVPEDEILKDTLKTLAVVLKPGGTLAIKEWALPSTGSGNDVAVFYDWVHLLNGAFFFPPRNATPSVDSDTTSQAPIRSIGTKYRKLAEWHSLMAGAGLEFSLEKSRLGSGGREPVNEANHSTTGGFLAVYLKPHV